MSYSPSELTYFVCVSRSEAEVRAAQLGRLGMPNRIVFKRERKLFEVRVAKPKLSCFGLEFRKLIVVKEPTIKEIEDIEISFL